VTRSILLVEDNLSDEKLALVAFRRSGFASDIVVVRDGAEALDYLHGTGRFQGRDARVLPSLVLLDLKLPRIDGLEVLRRIRGDARTRVLPVVVLTASREQQDVEMSYALGANAYVRKPVDFTEFAETAKTLSRFWLELNEPPPP
jgi:two-component system response regulator